MGYDTKLIVVSNVSKSKDGRKVGYSKVEASLELGCVAYDEVGKLIQRKREEGKKLLEKYGEKVEKAKADYKRIYDREGDFSEELKGLTGAEQDKITAKYYKETAVVEKNLPYMVEGNDYVYDDRYGDLL